MARPVWTWVALVLVALAVGHGLYLVLFGFQACSVAANDPGEPANQEECHAFVSWPGLVIVLLLAATGPALWMGRQGLAWAGAGAGTAIALVFGFSLGMLLYHAGLVLLACGLSQVGRWRQPRAPPAA